MTNNLPISNDKERVAKFKPRARLLLQLGDQLIKNESIALLELAKNSYDADASKVDIIMRHPDSIEDGYIEIEDDEGECFEAENEDVACRFRFACGVYMRSREKPSETER